MTGFVTLIVLLTLCGVVLFAAPHVPQFPLQLPEIPLLFLAPVVGVLWLLVLLFTLIKSACDRRDTKALDELRALLETRQQEDSHLAQDLREAQIRREHAQKYFEAVSQQSGSGPYLPPEAEACGPPCTRQSRRSPRSKVSSPPWGTRSWWMPGWTRFRRPPPGCRGITTPLRWPWRPKGGRPISSTPGSPPS